MNVFIEDGKLHYRVKKGKDIFVCDIVHNGKEYRLGDINGKACGLYFCSMEHMDRYFNKHHANSCLRKFGYVSRRMAKDAIKTFHSDEVMNVYHCIFCNHFHIGHTTVEKVDGFCPEKKRGLEVDKFLTIAQSLLNDIMGRIELMKKNKFPNVENLVDISIPEFSYDMDEFSKQRRNLKLVIRSKLLSKLMSHKISLSDENFDMLINFEYGLLRGKFIGHEELVDGLMVSWGGRLV